MDKKLTFPRRLARRTPLLDSCSDPTRRATSVRVTRSLVEKFFFLSRCFRPQASEKTETRTDTIRDTVGFASKKRHQIIPRGSYVHNPNNRLSVFAHLCRQLPQFTGLPVFMRKKSNSATRKTEESPMRYFSKACGPKHCRSETDAPCDFPRLPEEHSETGLPLESGSAVSVSKP